MSTLSSNIKPRPKSRVKKSNPGERASAIQNEIDQTAAWSARSYSIENLERLDDASALGLKAALRHGPEFGVWETPRTWFPMGTPGKLSFDLREEILKYVPQCYKPVPAVDGHAADAEKRHSTVQRHLDRAVGKLVRLMLLLRVGPAGFYRMGNLQPLDPSTIVTLGKFALPRLFALALVKHIKSEGRDVDDQQFLSVLAPEDFDDIDEGAKSYVLKEIRRLRVMNERGIWSDIFPDRERSVGTTAVAGEVEMPVAERQTDKHLPLPDDYVALMGTHCHWIIEEFAPAMMEVAEDVKMLWDAVGMDGNEGAIQQRRARRLRKLLRTSIFNDSKGNAIISLPFESRLARWWPMRSFRHFVSGMRLVQMAHFFAVGLPLAGRKSELCSLKRDCVRYSHDGSPYANGRTWKLIERHEGAEREFQIPNFSAHALEQQLKLVKLMESIGQLEPGRGRKWDGQSDHMWAEMGTGSSDCTRPLINVQAALLWFTDALGMDSAPGGQNLRVHRFRKTIARLAALAMNDAPKVLMDVFGHRDIEMTLYYILVDPGLQSDIERVARELNVMHGKEAIDAIVAAEDQADELAGFSGPAAVVLKGAVDAHREGLHERGEEWGAQTSMELAQVLTLNGAAFQIVRKGVFCLKFPGEAAPCTKKKGQPDVARCQSHCSNRLEESRARRDAEEILHVAVENYRKVRTLEDDLQKWCWAGQVKAHIGRFADIKQRWSIDPIVQEMLALGEEERVQ